MQKKLAGISLYGPTEMIDGDFPWVKRCWLVAVARGLLDGGIPWFMQGAVIKRMLDPT